MWSSLFEEVPLLFFSLRVDVIKQFLTTEIVLFLVPTSPQQQRDCCTVEA